MSALHCLSCEHENPRGAKFCQECGSRLNLKLCKQCEAINEINAQGCYQCGAQFALPKTVAAKASGIPWRLPRARTAVITACVFTVVAVIAFAYQFAYRQPVAAASNVAPQPALKPIPQFVATPKQDAAAPAATPAPASAATPAASGGTSAGRTAVTHTRPASAP